MAFCIRDPDIQLEVTRILSWPFVAESSWCFWHAMDGREAIRSGTCMRLHAGVAC